MKKTKMNIPLTIGMLILSFSIIIDRLFGLPKFLGLTLLLAALILEIWGGILYASSEEMKNSKLRRFKMKLIGKG